MIKAFTVSVLSMFLSSVQIAFVNENTEAYLEKAGLLKLTHDICIEKGTLPGNTGRMGTLVKEQVRMTKSIILLQVVRIYLDITVIFKPKN
jgi:hypothetical protein